MPRLEATESLVIRLSELLLGQKASLVTAESCTGGLLASELTAQSGCSSWFEGGWVCYSNEQKQAMLGVPMDVIERHGAVSIPVVEALAAGALARSNAAWAVAISGVAGPLGGTVTKPVGTICLSWQQRNGACLSETICLAGTRREIQEQVVVYGLVRLVRKLEQVIQKE